MVSFAFNAVKYIMGEFIAQLNWYSILVQIVLEVICILYKQSGYPMLVFLKSTLFIHYDMAVTFFNLTCANHDLLQKYVTPIASNTSES
jgi:hypothetical protein